MKIRMGFVAVLVAGGLALGACGAGEAVKPAEGFVRGVDHSNAQITIQHGDIPGFMRAMTMTFEVDDPSLLEGIEIDDHVDFRVRYSHGTYTVTAIDPRS